MIWSKKYTFLLLFSTTYFTGNYLHAQEIRDKNTPAQYRSINWVMDDGLPWGVCNFMIKDVKGFMWIGSLFGGLARFDGFFPLLFMLIGLIP
jgi:hypothetical protein